jgi:diacylglycerol kinase (ATP)
MISDPFLPLVQSPGSSPVTHQRNRPGMESPYKGKTGLGRIVNALRCSLDGLVAAYRHEDAFRQEIWLAALLLPAACLLPVSGIGRALMIGSVLLVLIVELLNSAIEAAVDRIGLESHRLSKRAKDIGSAAVFVALLNVLLIWGSVLFDSYR